LDHFNKDLTDWTPLSLDKATNMKLHLKLENNNPFLLDMRNYPFSRHCSLLLLSKKPQEVAGRTLSFLHNTIQELDILEVEEVVEGSKDSWVLLACLEVVQTCESHLVEGCGGGLWWRSRCTVHSHSQPVVCCKGETAQTGPAVWPDALN
jgi:hypothetical protein